MGNDFRFENFKSVFDFEQALKTRPVNEAFKGHLASRKHNSEWLKTESYEQADEFLTKGWNAEIDNVRSVCEKYSRTIADKRRKQIFDYVGFMPSVPRAIIGYPQSMINYTQRDTLEKKRILHIVLNSCSTGNVSGNTLLQCGLTVLKMVMILDKSNVKTKIDVVPKMGYCGNSCYGCTVTIKDYRQPFNYLKMAYPIANPSFFRRHGFAWMEQLDGDMRKWVDDYGCSLHRCSKSEKETYLEWAGLRDDGILYIDLDDCERADFDAEKLMENLGIK